MQRQFARLARLPLSRPAQVSGRLLRCLHSRTVAAQPTSTPGPFPVRGVAPVGGVSWVSGPVSSPLREETLADYLFDKIIRDFPTAPALVVRQESPEHHSLQYAGEALTDLHCLRWSYEELGTNVDALSRGLLQMGIRKGDRVGAFLGSNSTYAMLQWATAKVGAVLVCVNPASRGPELLSTLNLTGCKVLFINTSLRKNEHLPMLRDLLPSLTSSPLLAMSDAACPELRSVIIVDNDNAGAAAFETLLEREGFGGRDFRRVMQWDDRHNVQGVPGREQLDRNDVCNIQLTSGTTGASKGCSLTHRNLLNNGIYVGERMHLKFPRMDPASGKLVGETLANVPPLYHCFGLVLGNLAVATHAGCVVYPAESFDPALTLRAVVQERCTALHGVPTMFLAQLGLLEKHQKGEHVPGLSDLAEMDFSGLRTGIAAGSPVPDELMRRLVDKLNLSELVITYGMTETSPATVMSQHSDPIGLRCTTVGRVLPHAAVRIVNPLDPLYPSPDTPAVPVGEAGELWSAGAAVQKGYWNNENETNKVHFTDHTGLRWIMTGDQAIMDDQGYISIVGRIKDLVIRGGENISPVVVENRTVGLEGVFDCSVIAVPDPVMGEVVGMFVQRSAGTALTRVAVREHVNRVLSHQAAPDWVWWLDEDCGLDDWPKTASGKIRKVELRELSKDLVARGVGRVRVP